MTTISAKVIADSISHDGIRLVTMQLKYPRFIHAELMTHRVFSRNASSSRAVPVNKTIEWIKKDTAMPKHWGKNQKGMQADEECNEPIDHVQNIPMTREDGWIMARNAAIAIAEKYHAAGYHKQIVNRLLEPFAHINVVVTSTYWKNFLHLRDHKDAMPEIQMLAAAMKECLDSSPSEVLNPGAWHMPYVSRKEKSTVSTETLLKCSVARCARVSYLTFEGKEPIIEKDLELYDKLITSEPLHASPAEHQATPDERVLRVAPYWKHFRQHGNFVGWRQYRKTLPGEFVDEYRTYDPLNDCERFPWGFVVPEL